MSYIKKSSNIKSYTYKAVATAVMLSLNSGVYATCDYTAGDDFDNDGIINLEDGAPCDADLQAITFNRVINSDFEAGANFWAKVSADASYTSVDSSFDGSKAIEVATTKNNKGLNAPSMTSDGFSAITIRFWAKAVSVSDHSKPLKIKVTLKAEDGSLNAKGKPTKDKFLAPVFVDNQDDPNLTDDITIINAAEWTPISKTFIMSDIQAEADEAIALGGLTAGTRIDLDDNNKYNGLIRLQIQPAKAGDVILIDNVSLFGDTDKTAMLLNAITDTDNDGLMNDVDAHPTQAYFSELKPNDDFDGDNTLNSNDDLPYSTNGTTDSNGDGYADQQSAPLTNALSANGALELTDAEKDNWNIVKFISSIEAKVGNTSFEVDNAATSKANIVTFSAPANNQVSLGFWAKTDAAGIAADGDALSVRARLIAANADTTDISITQRLDNSNLTSNWQYFQVDKILDDTQRATDVEIILLKPTVPNAANIWIDGITLFTDPDADALLATQRDTDADGINDYLDADDDNDGLVDGEDPTPLIAVGSFDAPDINQDGTADMDDINTNGILDFFEFFDTTAPVLTLTGELQVEVIEGEVYTDAGATASDETDGDITANIMTTGGVDTNTVGTYTLTYNVSDAAGNNADALTRTVTVISDDFTAPVFSGNLPDLTFNKTSPSAAVILADLATAPVAIDAKDGEITAITKFKDGVYQPGNTYVITWVATDAAGNSAEITQNLMVTAPKVVIEEVENQAGSFSLTGLFLMVGLFIRRRVFHNKK